MTMYKTSDFHFDLPEHCIAQHPTPERTKSRLLVTSKDGTLGIEHTHFHEIEAFLKPGDLLIFNNSKVMKARLFGQKPTGGKVEVLIERLLSSHKAIAHLGSNKSLKLGSTIHIKNATLTVDAFHQGLFEISLAGSASFSELMDEEGHIPLPTYIQRKDSAFDENRYQTVYAKPLGSVAAPTAGLHFDGDLLARLENKGIEFGSVTLHVGAGTFKPVKTENLSEHVMHSEWIEVPEKTCEQILRAKQAGRRVIAVGTTTLRSLESAAAFAPSLAPYQGETSIFITPPYDFKVVDGLITNFHLPQSTLLMLVSAFSSREHMLRCYQEAIEQGYRFFSYGDAMLIV